MSLTAYEGRTLPSVFSDVHSRSEVAAAKEEVQQVRRRAGRMWIYILVIIGFLLAALFGAYLLWNALKVAEHDAANLATQVEELGGQQTAYADLTRRREELAKMRQDLNASITQVGQDRRNGEAWERELRALVQTTWTAQKTACGAPCTGPGWGDLLYPGQAQTWDPSRSAAVDAMDRETRMLHAVSEAVENRIAVIRRTPGYNAPRPGCENPLNCPQ